MQTVCPFDTCVCRPADVRRRGALARTFSDRLRWPPVVRGPAVAVFYQRSDRSVPCRLVPVFCSCAPNTKSRLSLTHRCVRSPPRAGLCGQNRVCGQRVVREYYSRRLLCPICYTVIQNHVPFSYYYYPQVCVVKLRSSTYLIIASALHGVRVCTVGCPVTPKKEKPRLDQ